MSGSNGDWAALASDNERLVVTATGNVPQSARSGKSDAVPARWSELASQRERFVDVGDSSGGPASSRRQTSELRLAVKAA